MPKLPYIAADTISDLSQKWMAAVSRYQHHDLTLNLQKAALLVVDLQNYFLDEKASAYIPNSAAIIPNVQKFLTVFRKAGQPIIFTAHIYKMDGSDDGIMGQWWGDLCREGTPEARIHDSVTPLIGERVITKQHYSAFYKTDLENIIRDENIEDLVICGVMTNLCCESTARDAFYRDYRVFFPVDATAANREELHLATLINLAYGFAYVDTSAEILSTI